MRAGCDSPSPPVSPAACAPAPAYRGGLIVVERSPIFVDGVRAAMGGMARSVLACRPGIEPLCAALQQRAAAHVRADGSGAAHAVLIGPHVLTREAFALCRWVRASAPLAPVVLISAQVADPLYQADALDMGASAVLGVDVTPDELLATLEFLRTSKAIAAFGLSAGSPVSLSDRELNVLRLIAAGKADPAIASELGLSTATVRKYSQRVLEKLNVHSRRDAVQRARHRGWL